MDISLYLRVLRDRLEEGGIDVSAIEKVLMRESAMAQGASAKDLESLLSLERLEIIVASAISRATKNKKKDETETNKTIVTHGSPNNLISVSSSETKKADVSDTFVPDKNTLSFEERTIIPEEKTLVPEEKTWIPKDKANPLFTTSDTRTIVISDNQSKVEEETVRVPSKLEKLFSDTATVRISERETVSFTYKEKAAETDCEEATIRDFGVCKDSVVFSDDVEEDTTSEENTQPLPFVKDEEITQPIVVTHDSSHSREQKESQDPLKVDSEALPEETVTIKSLRNPAAKRAFIWMTLLLLPSFLFAYVLFFAYSFLCMVALVTAYALSLLLYLGITVFPFLATLYSVGSAIVYFNSQTEMRALLELGIGFLLAGVSFAGVFFFTKPVISICQKIFALMTRFVKKTVVFLRSLHRSFVKGADRL